MKAKLDTLLPIKALSYWRYTRMARCQLSGAYPSSIVSATSRPTINSRAQLIGKIFHSQMELLHGLISAGNLSASEFRAGFNATLEGIASDVERDASSRHLGDIRLWPELTEIYTSLRSLFEFHQKSGIRPDAKTHSEETLYSKDKLLFGQLDAFFVDSSGIDLVDYKSGAMADGDAPKDDYANQLYFYAYLLLENFALYPKRLTLIGRNLQSMELQGSIERSTSIADDMRATFKRYNDAIAKPDHLEHIASPSPTNCIHCDAKPVCSAFWKAASDMELPERAHAVIGTQTLPFQTRRKGMSTLSIDVEEGSLPSGLLTISRFVEDRYPHIEDKVGQRLMFIDIRLLSTDQSAIAETTDRTIVLSVDD